MSARWGAAGVARLVAVAAAVFGIAAAGTLAGDGGRPGRAEPAPAAAPIDPPLICNPNSIFNLDISGNLYSLDPVTRANARLGRLNNGATSVNALGVTPGDPLTGEVRAYAAAQAGGASVFRSDGVEFTGLPGFPASGTGSVAIVMGAVDPSSGIYYYGGFGTVAGTRFLRILALDPSRPSGSQGLGEVARVAEANTSATAGDFAFDLSGNLFILIGRPSTGALANTSEIVRVDTAVLPVTPQSPPPTLPTTRITLFPSPAGAGFWNGVAFGADSNLYTQSTLDANNVYLSVINPNNPAAVNPLRQTFPAGSPAGNPNDLAGCSTPGTLTVQKELPAGRANPADQFTMTITESTTDLASNTTSGPPPATGIQPGEAGPIPAVPGVQYTISETLAQATTSSPDAYATTWSCIDTNPDGVFAPISGTGATFTLTFPAPDTGVEGANLLCTFTNTPVAPSLTLTKALGGNGRILPADQFTVAIADGFGASVGIGDPTTQGTGAHVEAGTGTLTVSPAADGPYTLTESMAPGSGSDSAQYQQIIQCADANGVQTAGLPSPQGAVFTGSFQLTPAPGADIRCLISNVAPEPVIELAKTLGSDRVRNTDQFTVAIRTSSPSGPELGPLPDFTTTTSGAYATVDPFTGSTGFAEAALDTEYFLTETAAGTPPTDTDLYASSVTCVDLAGLQTTGLPADAPLTPPPSVTPTNAGSVISCTITNTALPPTLALDKALDGPRVNADDQFTVRILSGDQTTPVAEGTSTGSGAIVTPGTGTTGVFAATAGAAYYMDEIPAEGSSTDLRQYSASLDCVDASGVQQGLPADQPFEGFLRIVPRLGARISCTITNAPIPPEVILTKDLGSDRVGAGDQFTVQILQNGQVVGVVDDATTQGAGSVVEPGTGITRLAPASAGSTYGLAEAAAGSTDLAAYARTISCLDEAGLHSELPDGPFSGSVTVTPVAGASVTCVIVNTAIAQVSLSVTKSSAPRPFIPGQPLTYTIVVANGGPDAAAPATVDDPLPPQLAGAAFTWTCEPSAAPVGSSCGAPSGSAPLHDTPTIAAGGRVTYTVTGIVPAGVTMQLANTVTVAPPPGAVSPGCDPSCTAVDRNSPIPPTTVPPTTAAPTTVPPTTAPPTKPPATAPPVTKPPLASTGADVTVALEAAALALAAGLLIIIAVRRRTPRGHG